MFDNHSSGVAREEPAARPTGAYLHGRDKSASGWQREGERTPLIGPRAFSPNTPSMGFGEMLGNRQPDATATDRA